MPPRSRVLAMTSNSWSVSLFLGCDGWRSFRSCSFHASALLSFRWCSCFYTIFGAIWSFPRESLSSVWCDRVSWHVACWPPVSEFHDCPNSLVGAQAVDSVLSYQINQEGQVALLAVPGITPGVFLVVSIGLYGRSCRSSCPQGTEWVLFEAQKVSCGAIANG